MSSTACGRAVMHRADIPGLSTDEAGSTPAVPISASGGMADTLAPEARPERECGFESHLAHNRRCWNGRQAKPKPSYLTGVWVRVPPVGLRPGGGIGSHARLKNGCSKERAGSSPAWGILPGVDRYGGGPACRAGVTCSQLGSIPGAGIAETSLGRLMGHSKQSREAELFVGLTRLDTCCIPVYHLHKCQELFEAAPFRNPGGS